MATVESPIKIKYRRPWLYPLQEGAYFNDSRFSLIEASTKSGKTIGGMAWLFERAILAQPHEERWSVASVYPQTKIAFRRLKQSLPDDFAQFCKFNESKLYNCFWPDYGSS